MPDQLYDAIVNVRESESLSLVGKALDSGEDPQRLLDACKQAMEEVGRRFEKEIYFMPELILAGEILRQITELVKPKLTHEVTQEKLAKIVIGTVQGDIHDIGKDIVVFMLDINGFEVIDLGVDVPPERFVEAVTTHDAPIIGLSGFLTLAFDPMKATVEALVEAEVRENVKVMIGGGPINEQVQAYAGADAWGDDASEAVRLARLWISGET